MNHYAHTRLAEQRLEQAARRARTAWTRSQVTDTKKREAPVRRPRLDWIVPVTTRIAGA